MSYERKETHLKFFNIKNIVDLAGGNAKYPNFYQRINQFFHGMQGRITLDMLILFEKTLDAQYKLLKAFLTTKKAELKEQDKIKKAA